MNERNYVKYEKVEEDFYEAQSFLDFHAHKRTPEEHSEYQRILVERWIERGWEAESGHTIIRPMWLSRYEGNDAPSGVVFDYLTPTCDDDFDVYATITIYNDGDSTQIELVMPKEDGSGEPYVIFQKQYSLYALDLALQIAESCYL